MRRGGVVGEQRAGAFVVEMGEGATQGAGVAGSVEEAGVVELVGDDAVARSGEGGQDGEIGHEAGGEEEGGLGLLEAGEGGFELVMEFHGAGDEARGAGAHAVAGEGVACGVDDGGVGGEAEIVIRGELEILTSVYGEGGPLRAGHFVELAEKAGGAARGEFVMESGEPTGEDVVHGGHGSPGGNEAAGGSPRCVDFHRLRSVDRHAGQALEDAGRPSEEAACLAAISCILAFMRRPTLNLTVRLLGTETRSMVLGFWATRAARSLHSKTPKSRNSKRLPRPSSRITSSRKDWATRLTTTRLMPNWSAIRSINSFFVMVAIVFLSCPPRGPRGAPRRGYPVSCESVRPHFHTHSNPKGAYTLRSKQPERDGRIIVLSQPGVKKCFWWKPRLRLL